MSKHLHIISFDIPYPANYGGVIDVFYKLKSLVQSGVKVHLHCYEYSRIPHLVLKELCYKVYYYPRNTAKSKLFNRLPYIVASRSSDLLLQNLLKDDYPILMEGLHSTFHLSNDKLYNRKLIVRTHNIEHDYYQSLARVEGNVFKRYYFYNEATKLESYENILHQATHIFAISPNDKTYLHSRYGKAHYIPAFHPFNELHIAEGKGSFALYHGNLSVGENNEAAIYLVKDVFSKVKIPFVIAGSKPSMQLREAIAGHSHISLQADIDADAIHHLIHTAQINVLPTFQPTGIKLKLLSALFNGRHAVVNDSMIQNTGLETLCHIANDADSVQKKINSLMKKSFLPADIEKRKKILLQHFSNNVNASTIVNIVWG